MKILKLLNKKFLTIILTFLLLFTQSVESTEPVDIWNLESEKDINEIKDIEEDESTETITNSIYEMQSQKKNDSEIQEDETLLSAKKEIIGLYDPEENNLTMEMWLNSDGEKILNLLNKIQKIKLSNDAKEIMNIALLTNSYFPEKNISKEVFLKFKSNWLIKNNDLKLMEEYLIKNQNVDENLKIIKFLVDDYLSKSELEKACNIFSKLNGPINDDYLFKFQTYCLINDNKKEQAQLLLDLKKELGFEDIFFEKKFNYLIGYDVENDQKISEKSILEFHLSHRTNINFEFEPSETTSSKIWRYLSTSNLLDNIKDVNLEDQNKINIIEKATHDGNYLEKELYDLYKRFQFSINQLLSVKQSYKLLSDLEGRALVYQGILITSEAEPKLELVKILKESFLKEKIGDAFKVELSRILKDINIEDVPSNYTNFYNRHVNIENLSFTKIKINNKIIHQSKLLNYFRKEISIENIENDLNELLKKIKKDKNYYISIKDIILIETLRSDGAKLLKKYNDIYEVNNSDIPSDIQTFINNDEVGMVLLRLVQVIGEDELKDMGPETLYFIINALNQLNIDPLRNKILLKVLPLKV